MVLSIEAKKCRDSSGWEAYTDCGREKTGVDVLEWAKEGVKRGAGEILLTSVDHEGMCKGFDLELCRQVSSQVSVPVILSGGMGSSMHLVEAFTEGKADAVAIAHVLHYKKTNVSKIREDLKLGNIPTRQV